MSFSVCIFCGSSSGDDPRYADAALGAGGRVVGVVPRFLYEREVGHDGVTSLEVVGSLAERKLRMGELSDAFLSLPGGIGTLDELFEAWSWSQVGLQSKPSALLNVAGYYDALVSFIERATAAGFVKPQHRQWLSVSDDVGELLDGFRRRPSPT